MSVTVVARRFLNIIALALLVTISAVTAGSLRTSFNQRSKAFYMPDMFARFIRPGLSLKVTGATIATNGTMTATVTLADPGGAPLDRTGANSPGAVAVNCTMAVMPKNSNNFTSYTPLAVKGTNGVSGTEVWYDFGGTWAAGTVDGTYTYTFGTKAPTAFDATATHRIGCNAIRDLTAFDAGTFYAGSTLDFVPGSATPPTAVHDVVNEAACTSCHLTLAFHGGNAQGLNLCVMCHTTQSADPTTGNGLDFPTLIHKVHMGKNLPSVVAGKKYQINGFGGIADFSTVTYPPDPGQCQTCHEAKYGAKQAARYATPSRAACGSCHDNVDFTTGANHATIIQKDDTACATCHVLKGTQPLDISITNAHINPAAGFMNQDTYDFIPGMVFGDLKVQNTAPGQKPTITFTLKDKAGKAFPLSELAVSPGRIAAVLSGNTWDYGWENFGSDVTTAGYVSETVTSGGSCDAAGNCTYTFNHAIPKDAQGTYAMMLEGRRAFTLLPGTTKQVATEVGAHNLVTYFAVDKSPVTPRRTVVDLNKCNNCHSYLSLHGTNRDRIEACVICHNPSENDSVYRGVTTNAAQKALPPQTVNFSYMIHRIHGGEDLTKFFGINYTIVGFGGSTNDFSDVRYPVMDATGATGNLARCDACHANNSQTVLPLGLLPVKTTQDVIKSLPATTAACFSCHASSTMLSHALDNSSSIGESCTVCHGVNGEFSVAKAHAQ